MLCFLAKYRIKFIYLVLSQFSWKINRSAVKLGTLATNVYNNRET